MLALWEQHGDAFYHLPDFVLRQEWFHSMSYQTRSSPSFFASLPVDGTLLDWGCGTAENSRRGWIDHGGRTILMDVPGPNFDYCKAKYAPFHVEHRPVSEPLPRGYDALVCLDVLEHVTEPIKVLESLWDGLKPGGQALLWFDDSLPAAGHLPDSIALRGDYDRWLLKHATIRWQGGFDWVEKPRRWWALWT